MTIHEAICAILKTVGPVEKEKTNQQQGFKYRGIDDVLNSLHKAFSEHGVYIRVAEIKTALREQHTTAKGGILFYSINDYKFLFTASDGTFVEAWGRGEAMDSADKSSNKAISVALKYCLMQMFLIPTEEEKDPDAQYPQPVAKMNGARKERTQQITDEQAIQLIRQATTVDALAATWKAIGPNLQAYPVIMQEKEKRKQELLNPVTQ